MRFITSLLLLFYHSACLAQDKVVETVPVVGGQVSNGMNAMSMILSLLMVLAVIVISAFLLKHFNVIQNNTSQLKVVASLPLTSKEKLIVVQVGDKQLLLGVTAQQINLIESLEEPLEISKPTVLQKERTLWDFLKTPNGIKKS
ncbi:MAG: flagellar biosynthetic protein FliO [Gammaproteobacteria bacterium]|nr:MAG: flagellar biosynthetic protein FliO [Gammaproteobacteria bacterium]